MLLRKYVYSRKIRCDLYKKYGRNLYKVNGVVKEWTGSELYEKIVQLEKDCWGLLCLIFGGHNRQEGRGDVTTCSHD